MTTRQVVAANVRARLAWNRMTKSDLERRFGWSTRTVHNKLHGLTGFTDAELDELAGMFGLSDPGALFRVPEGFVTSESVSACTRLALVRTCEACDEPLGLGRRSFGAMHEDCVERLVSAA